MAETLSFHVGTVMSFEHNVDRKKRMEEKHIIPELTNQNVILKAERLPDAYEKLFGQSLREYNEMQVEKGHPERQKGDAKNYLLTIQKNFEKEKNRENNLKDDEKLGRRVIRPSYEVIVQVGDINSKIDRDTQVSILQDMYKKFVEENRQLYVYCAAIHVDEKAEDGRLSGVHMHLDYIPVAQCERGISLQPQLARALNQQNPSFEGEHAKATAQMKWQEHMRGVLSDVAREHGVEIVHKHENREHLDREKNRLYQQSRDLSDNLKEKGQELDAVRSAYDSVHKDLTKERAELEEIKKIPAISPKPVKRLGGEFYRADEVKAYLTQAHVKLTDSEKEKNVLRQDIDTYKRVVGQSEREKDNLRDLYNDLCEKQWDKDYLKEQMREIDRSDHEHEHFKTRDHEHDRDYDR